MNTRERFLRIMNFEPCDRTLDWEWVYWAGSIRRWYKEGLPKIEGIPESFQHADIIHGPGLYWPSSRIIDGTQKSSPLDKDVSSYFNFDKGITRIPLNIFLEPTFKTEIIAEDKRTRTLKDPWGITLKESKETLSAPAFIEWPVKNREDWEKIKEEKLQANIKNRLPSNWKELIKEFNNRDYPLMFGHFPCGFYGVLRYLMGDVGLSIMMYDNPLLIKDIENHFADLWIELYAEVLKDVTPDWCLLWEDMAYNSGPMISPECFKEFLTPSYKKLTNFLKTNGVKNIIVDCDGDTWKLIPLWIEAGVTGQYPLEVGAGMDIIKLRKEFPRFQLIGGIDKKEIVKGKDAIDKVLEKVPDMIKKGGYIPFLDHATHEEISWENFKYYRQKLKEIINNNSVGDLN